MKKQFCAMFALVASMISPIAGTAQIKVDKAERVRPEQAAAASNSPANPKARYRITLNGFICNRPTNDDVTQSDGVDDEVFVVTEARLINMRGENGSYSIFSNERQPPPVRAQTMVVGDANNHPNRLRGGSGHNVFGGNGGFNAGDRYPTTTPWARAGAPQTDRFPLVVWQGELTQKANVLMVMPTVWEWDDTPGLFDSIFDNSPLRFTDNLAATLSMFANGDYRSRPVAANEIGLLGAPGTEITVRRSLMGDKKDRPIGMNSSGGDYSFTPQFIAFTYDSAEEALRSDPVGRGPGVFEINYKDHPDLRGDYTLYLQIERMP